MRSVLVLLVLAAASCRPRPGRPNVVLIVVDTLRADSLGAWGNPRGLTPFIDRWSDDGTRFANAYAASSWTSPSVASILTSRYPTQHKVTSFSAHLADDETTLADVLGREGWATGAFSANVMLNQQIADAGFDDFRTYWTWSAGSKLPAAPVIRKSLGWVDVVRRETPGRPVFLYYQFMEPHAPYQPPEPYRTRFAGPEPPPERLDLVHMRFLLGRGEPLTIAESLQLLNGGGDIPRWFATWRLKNDVTRPDLAYARSLYDGEVAAIDAELRRLFVALDARGILRHAIVVVTADHGEEFGEHGLFTHGTGLYREVIHVPLAIVADGIRHGVQTQAVSLVDVAPTVLDLAGVPPEPTFEGRSLVPLAVDGDRSVDVVSELPETGSGGVPMHTQAVIRDGIAVLMLTRGKATVTGQEVYDLRTDPGESAAPSPALWARGMPLMVSLQRFSTAIAARARDAAPTVQPSDRTRDKLRALGYVN